MIGEHYIDDQLIKLKSLAKSDDDYEYTLHHATKAYCLHLEKDYEIKNLTGKMAKFNGEKIFIWHILVIYD